VPASYWRRRRAAYTTCPSKGKAVYDGVRVGDRVKKNAAFCYETCAMKESEGRVAFYAGANDDDIEGARRSAGRSPPH
jgi:uncharacterized protein (DUF427 family)